MTTVVHRTPDKGAGGAGTPGAAVTGSGRLGPPTSTSSWPLLVGLTAAVSFVVSIVTVGRASLSLDESVSATLARAPWHVFTQTVLHREANMALYYLLLRVWAAAARPLLGPVAGPETVLRTLSVVAAVGAVAVVMVATRRLFDRRTAVVCGALLAVDPLVMMFAQDARGYALSLLLVSASSALLLRGLRSPDARAVWVAYAVISALAAYANFWAALVPLAHGVSLAFLPAGTAPWRRLVPTGIGLGVLLVPLALLIHATDSSGVNWAAGSSAGKIISTLRADVPHPVLDAAAVLVVVALAAAVTVMRRRPAWRVPIERWPVVFASCWLVVPIAAVLLLSLTYKPLLVLRYLVICLPPLVMLLSYAVTRVRGTGAAAAAVAAAGLAAVSVAGVGALVAHGSPQDWRGAVASVADRSRPGDGVVVFAPYTRIPFQWYVVRDGVQRNLHPLFPTGPWTTDAVHYDTSIAVTRAGIEADVAGTGRVWVVLSQQELYPAEDAALVAGLRGAGLEPGPIRVFHGVEVVLYSSHP